MKWGGEKVQRKPGHAVGRRFTLGVKLDVGLLEPWLLSLDRDLYDQIVAALELLAERGP